MDLRRRLWWVLFKQFAAWREVLRSSGSTTTLASCHRSVRFGCACSCRSSQISAEFCESMPWSQSGRHASRPSQSMAGLSCSQNLKPSIDEESGRVFCTPPLGGTKGIKPAEDGRRPVALGIAA
eukprot:scaffold32495_cov60-Phaeocystis_antarctica.AAC.9